MLAAWWPSYRLFIGKVNSVLSEAGGSPTSWYRDAARNRSVGGSPTSQHLLGFAVDVVTSNPQRLIAAARAEGMVAIDEGDHIHIQAFRAGQLDRSFFDL